MTIPLDALGGARLTDEDERFVIGILPGKTCPVSHNVWTERLLTN